MAIQTLYIARLLRMRGILAKSVLVMRKPCCDKQDSVKGAWSRQEDQKLIDYIRKHGEGCWRALPKAAGLHRCGKSCRLRWINYLRPDLKRGNFEEDEEDLIIKMHALLGNRWSLIAGRLPGRTDNEVKNYWNSHLKKKLVAMGIDPNNHRVSVALPRARNSDDSLDASSASLVRVEANDNKNAVPDCEQASDSSSCHVESSCALPDLNVDLSTGVSPPCASKVKLIRESEAFRHNDL